MRRFLSFLLWLFAASAQAGVVRLPQGGQLSFSFAPAPVLAAGGPSASPALAAPSLIPAVQPAPAPFFAPIPRAVAEAFHSGDATAFVRAARRAEYRPPEGDEQQSALYQLGLEREAAERSARALVEAAAPPPVPERKRGTRIDYEEFGRQLAAHPGLSANPFQHAAAKRRILKASGYSRLYGAGGPVAIESASDVRVGKAFENVRRAFERR